MNGEGHRLTTKAALDSLPEWERDVWAPEKEDLERTYSMYGDLYPLNKKELGPYVELPDGSIPDFYMPKLRCKHHYDSGIDFWEAPFYDQAFASLSHFSARIADSLASDNIATAARFAGTMAHFFEDNAVPAHAMDDTDLETIKDLLPPPVRMRCFPFHSEMERNPSPFDLKGYEPAITGTSVPEVGFLFIDRLVETTLFARSRVLDFFKAFYDGDDARIAELNTECCVFAAKVYADYTHTLTLIAFDRMDASDVDRFQRVSLSGIYPYRQTAWAGGGYTQTAPFDLIGRNLDASCKPIDAVLKLQDDSIVECSDSLCGTAHYEYEFRIPKGVYNFFSFDYGLNAKMNSNFPIIFEVGGNDEVLFRQEVSPGEPAKFAELEIPKDAESLKLITTLDEKIDVPRVNGRPIAETGHAIWGNPFLLK